MEKKKVILLFGQPQECGDPYVSVIRLTDGQVDRTINIPEGYWNSGREYAGYKELMDEKKIENHSGNYLPELGETQAFENFKTGNIKRYILTEITDVKESKLCNSEFIFYDAKLHYTRYRERMAFRFSSAKDTFKKEMEEQGINMKGWCVYKRRKHTEEEFLKAVIPHEDEEVVNFIYC